MKRAFPTALVVAAVLIGILMVRFRSTAPPTAEPEHSEVQGASSVRVPGNPGADPGLGSLSSPEVVNATHGDRSAVEPEVVESDPPAPRMTRIIVREAEGDPVPDAMVMVLGNREANSASSASGNCPITYTNEHGVLDVELGAVGGYYV